jgi:hypothetical protein
MSGGWPALVCRELAIGVFLGLVWRFLVMRRPTDRKLVLYAVVAALMANGGLDWVSLVRGSLQELLVYGVATAMLFRAIPTHRFLPTLPSRFVQGSHTRVSTTP